MTNNVHRRDFLKALRVATAAVWDGTRAEAADTRAGDSPETIVPRPHRQDRDVEFSRPL